MVRTDAPFAFYRGVMTETTNDTTVPVPAPEQRISLPDVAPDVYRAMAALDRTAAHGLDPILVELIRMRASQLNGCAFCLNMHSADARAAGEAEHRLYTLSAWWETPYFTARERAALALTEAVTQVADGHVPDDVYAEAARHFDEQELARVIGVTVAINSWNRIVITSRTPPPPHDD